MTSLRCANSAFPARTFVQLAKRRYASSASILSNAPPLDFLIPSRVHDHSVFRNRDAPTSLSWLAKPIRISSPLRFPIRRLDLRRHLSTTLARNATVCVQNPQTDEDGNSMTLEITPRAAKRLTEIMERQKNPNLALRIQVESGGCHGFQYLMSLITIPSEDATGAVGSSSLLNDDDCIFQFVSDDASTSSSTQASPKIILDEASLDLLKGSKVDFTIELIGSQFKIVDNPYATSSCGCGTSFDYKM